MTENTVRSGGNSGKVYLLPHGTHSPLPPSCFQKLVAYPRPIPGKTGEVILWGISTNRNSDIRGFPQTRRPVTTSHFKEKLIIDKLCPHAEIQI